MVVSGRESLNAAGLWRSFQLSVLVFQSSQFIVCFALLGFLVVIV